jgi:lipopolysaccharide/colanic/teichoic acid biosynthesis glycosyltransferase
MKRLIDVVLTTALLLLSAPLQILLALAVRLDSPGPAWYCAIRVGRDGHPFTLYKFRTMIVRPRDQGPAITHAADPRITRLGAFLRRTRLDELPQLFNVLRGDMSLVGPRPEDPHFVALYSPAQRRVLSVRPGLTGRAQLTFLDEAELLGHLDPEGEYIRVVLPRKVAIDLQYIDDRSLLVDLRLIWATIRVLIEGLFNAGAPALPAQPRPPLS